MSLLNPSNVKILKFYCDLFVVSIVVKSTLVLLSFLLLLCFSETLVWKLNLKWGPGDTFSHYFEILLEMFNQANYINWKVFVFLDVWCKKPIETLTWCWQRERAINIHVRRTWWWCKMKRWGKIVHKLRWKCGRQNIKTTCLTYWENRIVIGDWGWTHRADGDELVAVVHHGDQEVEQHDDVDHWEVELSTKLCEVCTVPVEGPY